MAEDATNVERCLTAATGHNFVSVAYGRECRFGSSLRSPLTKVGDDNSNFLCAGNPLQYCSSGNQLVLHLIGADPVLPSHPVTVSSATFFGCMNETTGARALGGASSVGGHMTLENCGEFCGPAMRYFAVEYGQERELDQTFSLVLKGGLRFFDRLLWRFL